MQTWDEFFMDLAKMFSTRSKDVSTKCGAVIVDRDKVVIGSGYNGFPRGVADTKALLENRPQKYPRVLHAEENAILFASRIDLCGCTIYVWPLPPCGNCMAKIIQKKIGRVVTKKPTKGQRERWGLSFDAAMDMATQTDTLIDFI